MATGTRDRAMNPWIQILIGFCILLVLILLPMVLFTGTTHDNVPSNLSGNPVKVRILAVNDFHGQISSGKTLGKEPAGSAPVLGSYLQSAMNSGDQTSTILALPGDIVGASPPDSGLLLDEPSIIFFNTFANGCCGNNGTSCTPGCNGVATFGNHEFDKGIPELMRKLNGGNGSTTIPHIVDPFPGAQYPYVCSNVVWTTNNTPIVPPYTILEAGGVPIAFIGADTVQTTELEMPSNIEGVSFANETESINRYVPVIQSRGVHAIVVLLHEGGTQAAYEGPTRTGGNLTGRVVGIVSGLDPDVDVVLSGHTHNFSNAYLNNSGGKPVLVTQAFNYSVAFAEVDLTIDPKTRDITNKTAMIIPAYADLPPGTHPDPAAAQILAEADNAVAPMTTQVIATAATDITRTQNTAGESALGDLVADGQRAAMATDVGFITTGSLRADIQQGTITWGNLYAVQPFSATVLSMTLNGSQIRGALERQWQTPLPPHNLAVSGLSYKYDPTQPVGNRVYEVRVNGVPLIPGKNYRAAMVDYLASGGDGYTVFTGGTNLTSGPVDVDALVSYTGSLPQPVNVTTGNRITIRA
jgi:5'-nucleotidase